MFLVTTKLYTGGISDSDSDSNDDQNLGGLKPVRRFQRSTTPSNTIPKQSSNQASFHDLNSNTAKELGDFEELIAFLRETGAFPNLPPISLSESTSTNIESQSTALVKYNKHSCTLSSTSDVTTTSISSSAAYSSPPSSPDDYTTATTRYKQPYKSKEVRWAKSVAHGSEFKYEVVKQKESSPSRSLYDTIFDQSAPGNFGFFPSSIVLPPPLEQPHFNLKDIHPKYTLTLVEKQMKLIRKLSEKFSDEPDMVGDPLRIVNLASNESNNGIHVFVDLSNILIGFAEQLKAERKIPKSVHKRQPPIAFHSLAMVLERGRQVARRVLAGSTPPNDTSTVPKYILEAQACGYELNILERVRKLKPAKNQPSRNFKKEGGGNSSASDAGTVMTNTEQAVDEILHLKMMESMIDNDKPSTMVLASGDAARAEYSEGFLAMVMRALKRGWKVEVIAWRMGLSADYRSPFLKSWDNQFKIILLDDYCEEMLAIYAEKYLMMDMNSYDRFV